MLSYPEFHPSQITTQGRVALMRGNEANPVCEIKLHYDPDSGEGGTATSSGVPFDVCKQAGDNSGICNDCFEGKGQFSGRGEGIWTAVGCIPVRSPSGDATSSVTVMIRSFITIGLGLAGGVVVLMVLAGSFLLSTSQGDLKRVEEGKNLISSAVIGLLFVIFSVTILRFIGVDILQLPGFGR